MKKIFNIGIFLILNVGWIEMQAQHAYELEVWATAGDIHYTDDGSVSWTIGESFTELLNGSEHIITQGFQQVETPQTTAVGNLVRKNFGFKKTTLKIFPNPTTDFLQLQSSTDEELTAELFDIHGKSIMKRKWRVKATLRFAHLPDQLYMLRIRNLEGQYETFKVNIY